MRKKTTIWFFVLIVFVLPVTAYALVNWYENNLGSLPVIGASKEVNGRKVDHTVEGFSLINQDGLIVSDNEWKGKIVVADFFFTHCPAICPRMTNHLKKVQQAYANDDDVIINSFSVDPERDSVGQLKKYSSQFNIDNRSWQLLTGDKKDIYKLARNGFMIVATDGDGGPTDFIHSEKLVLVDRQKRIRGYYNGTSDKEVDELIRDIKKLKHEN